MEGGDTALTQCIKKVYTIKKLIGDIEEVDKSLKNTDEDDKQYPDLLERFDIAIKSIYKTISDVDKEYKKIYKSKEKSGKERSDSNNIKKTKSLDKNINGPSKESLNESDDLFDDDDMQDFVVVDSTDKNEENSNGDEKDKPKQESEQSGTEKSEKSDQKSLKSNKRGNKFVKETDKQAISSKEKETKINGEKETLPQKSPLKSKGETKIYDTGSENVKEDGNKDGKQEESNSDEVTDNEDNEGTEKDKKSAKTKPKQPYLKLVDITKLVDPDKVKKPEKKKSVTFDTSVIILSSEEENETKIQLKDSCKGSMEKSYTSKSKGKKDKKTVVSDSDESDMEKENRSKNKVRNSKKRRNADSDSSDDDIKRKTRTKLADSDSSDNESSKSKRHSFRESTSKKSSKDKNKEESSRKTRAKKVIVISDASSDEESDVEDKKHSKTKKKKEKDRKSKKASNKKSKDLLDLSDSDVEVLGSSDESDSELKSHKSKSGKNKKLRKKDSTNRTVKQKELIDVDWEADIKYKSDAYVYLVRRPCEKLQELYSMKKDIAEIKKLTNLSSLKRKRGHRKDSPDSNKKSSSSDTDKPKSKKRSRSKKDIDVEDETVEAEPPNTDSLIDTMPVDPEQIPDAVDKDEAMASIILETPIRQSKDDDVEMSDSEKEKKKKSKKRKNDSSKDKEKSTNDETLQSSGTEKGNKTESQKNSERQFFLCDDERSKQKSEKEVKNKDSESAQNCSQIDEESEQNAEKTSNVEDKAENEKVGTENKTVEENSAEQESGAEKVTELGKDKEAEKTVDAETNEESRSSGKNNDGENIKDKDIQNEEDKDKSEDGKVVGDGNDKAKDENDKAKDEEDENKKSEENKDSKAKEVDKDKEDGEDKEGDKDKEGGEDKGDSKDDSDDEADEPDNGSQEDSGDKSKENSGDEKSDKEDSDKEQSENKNEDDSNKEEKETNDQDSEDKEPDDSDKKNKKDSADEDEQTDAESQDEDQAKNKKDKSSKKKESSSSEEAKKNKKGSSDKDESDAESSDTDKAKNKKAKSKKRNEGSSSEEDKKNKKGSSDKDESDAESSDTDKAKNKKAKSKKRNESSSSEEDNGKSDKKTLSSDDSDSDGKDKRSWRKEKALTTITISTSDTEEEIQKKKKKGNAKRDAGSDSDDDAPKEKKKRMNKKKKRSAVISDSDSDKWKSDKSGESSSSSSSEEEKERSEKKKPNRKRIKRVKDSSSSDEDDKSTRKQIRRVWDKNCLADTTKKAEAAERERKQRIVEKQKKYNHIFEIPSETNSKVEKVVLDFNEKTKEELLKVDEDIVDKLKPHQASGIQFMWNACFESLKMAKKEKGSGCILAHCMGLGKTLQVIALTHTLLTNEVTGVKKVMVVCPVNTVLNWVAEYKRWMPDEDDVEIYDLVSCKPNERQYELKNWENTGGVLIIGYNMFRTLSSPDNKKLNKKVKKLFQESFVDPGPDLVICDEGHLLKNEKSHLSIAMNRIKCMRRIVLTGTPLQNNLKEYFCMVQFIKPNLLGTYKEYLNRFVNPITNGQYTDSTPHDIALMRRRSHVLHKLLDGVVQRRDYSVLAPYLPQKHEYILFLSLTELQIKLYEHYLKNFAKRGNSKKTKTSFLFVDFQELQGICTHPRVLVEKKNDRDKKDMFADDDEEEEDESEGSLKEFIDDGESSAKSTSSSSSSDSEHSGSEHSGSEKEKGKGKGKSSKSPRKRLTRGALAAAKENGEEVEMLDSVNNFKTTGWWSQYCDHDAMEDISHSSKIVLLLNILKECEQMGDKVLLFSQSLYSLSLIEYFLEKIDEATQDGKSVGGFSGSWALGLDYFRLDGSSSCDNRASWCNTFNHRANTRARLFLISTRAGGLGINLVAANRVIIFDVSWNPSHDIQSIYRVYRFGQLKPCYIYRFVTYGTMEMKIYERQVTKQAISKRVIDEQQIDRHYNQMDLAELYNFEPRMENRPIPLVPKDVLLGELIQKFEDKILSYHEHHTLLENKEDEELNEEERKAAWEEFENEKVARSTTSSAFGSMSIGGQQITAHQITIALTNIVKRDNPAWTAQQIRSVLPAMVRELEHQVENGIMTMYNRIQKEIHTMQMFEAQKFQVMQQQQQELRMLQIQQQQIAQNTNLTEPQKSAMTQQMYRQWKVNYDNLLRALTVQMNQQLAQNRAQLPTNPNEIIDVDGGQSSRAPQAPTEVIDLND